MTIPESQAAAYRRLAALMPEAGLLDACGCFGNRDDCYYEHKENCVWGCNGTGKLVPPLEVWLGRLVRAALGQGQHVIIVSTPKAVRGPYLAAIKVGMAEYGPDPESALVDAMLQALEQKEAT